MDSGSSFSSIMLPPGQSTVKVVARDNTPKVRKDDEELLVAEHQWEVNNIVGTPPYDATFHNGLLTVPYVRLADGALFQVTLAMISGDPIQLKVVSAAERDRNSKPQSETTLNSGIVHIGRLYYEGTVFDARFAVISDSPDIVLQLRSAQER